MADKLALGWESRLEPSTAPDDPATVIIPPRRVRYLSEIADTVRDHKHRAEAQAAQASTAYALRTALKTLGVPVPDGPEPIHGHPGERTAQSLVEAYNQALDALDPHWREELAGFDARKAALAEEATRFTVRDRELSVENYSETLSHTRVPKLVMPRYRDWGDRLRWLMLENTPGRYPFTGGAFPFKRAEEEPTRMFAGEGPPERTNRRFHYVSAGMPAKRLSTAFDSVTLYGDDPHPRPDIYGKVGNSGVSICTVDDMKRLYSGFDLVHPSTSVSMTINGPAPVMLAFFLHTAIDQQVERHLHATGGWSAAQERMRACFRERDAEPPTYRGERPAGNDGLGLALLGVSGERLVPRETYARIKADTLRVVRGTVQADILKEDQAQNTCIFSTEFALKVMGDIQAYFCDYDMANFWPSRWPTASRSWSTTSPAACPSTSSRATCRSSSPTGWTRSTP
jgi:methylmalonyl-CoA mutase